VCIQEPCVYLLSAASDVIRNSNHPDSNNSDSQMQGVWDLGDDSAMGDPVPASYLAFQLGGRSDGGSW
jgi:hypothetical protein